jgi:hypothetical protein
VADKGTTTRGTAMKTFKEFYTTTEEHGAGEEGTDGLLKKYADDTPGQSYSDIKKKQQQKKKDEDKNADI